MSDNTEDRPCPECGVTMPVQVDRQLRYSRLESHSRWECNNDRCPEWGTTFFDDNETLVVAPRSIRPGDPRYCDICQEPLHLDRQPLQRGAVQDAEVPARVPRALRLERARPRLLPDLLRLLQP